MRAEAVSVMATTVYADRSGRSGTRRATGAGHSERRCRRDDLVEQRLVAQHVDPRPPGLRRPQRASSRSDAAPRMATSPLACSRVSAMASGGEGERATPRRRRCSARASCGGGAIGQTERVGAQQLEELGEVLVHPVRGQRRIDGHGSAGRVIAVGPVHRGLVGQPPQPEVPGPLLTPTRRRARRAGGAAARRWPPRRPTHRVEHRRPRSAPARTLGLKFPAGPTPGDRSPTRCTRRRGASSAPRPTRAPRHGLAESVAGVAASRSLSAARDSKSPSSLSTAPALQWWSPREQREQFVVDQAVGRHPGAARRDRPRPGEVGEASARLGEDHRHRRHVPQRDLGIDHRLDAAGGHQGVAVAVAPRPQLEPASLTAQVGVARPVVERRTWTGTLPARRCASLTRGRLAVDEAAEAPAGVHDLAERGQVDHADGRAVLVVRPPAGCSTAARRG